MPNYWVSWEIDMDADSPQAAAERALSIMRDPASIATVFTVTDERGNEAEVDLLNEEEADCASDRPAVINDTVSASAAAIARVEEAMRLR